MILSQNHSPTKDSIIHSKLWMSCGRKKVWRWVGTGHANTWINAAPCVHIPLDFHALTGLIIDSCLVGDKVSHYNHNWPYSQTLSLNYFIFFRFSLNLTSFNFIWEAKYNYLWDEFINIEVIHFFQIPYLPSFLSWQLNLQLFLQILYCCCYCTLSFHELLLPTLGPFFFVLMLILLLHLLSSPGVVLLTSKFWNKRNSNAASATSSVQTSKSNNRNSSTANASWNISLKKKIILSIKIHYGILLERIRSFYMSIKTKHATHIAFF